MKRQMHHSLAVIHRNAQIGKDVTIGPFVVIEDDVVIEDGTWIGAHAVIMSGSRIGKNCKIFPGAVIGAVPQDLKFNGECTLLEIGDNTTIREYCTLNRGTDALGRTSIGNNCLLMAYVHVAHDCTVGNHCILANNATLAGHVEVEDNAILGGMTAVHQFTRIGAHCMLGGGSLVNKDVPPFVRAARYPVSYIGINTVGLRRRGFSDAKIRHVRNIYHTLFVQHQNRTQALKAIETEIEDSKERQMICDFVKQSRNGVIKGPKTISRK
ncbi:MAG: acyl-ACP--UDP-N-acetylglucosamine O-acyltransferase [Saprospiraceae bacterium]|nr:acyl-ACP--UDP-N-acetylglucosamine O-acyltransferase [Saprospiraceae bacterium]